MLKKILSISGKSGLFRLVNRGKNMLIVENIATGRRQPAYSTDKVVSLGDISIYTIGDDAAVRAYFKTVLPDYDEDRVYTTDIRKLLSWYNQLIAAGIKDFKDEEIAQDQAAEVAEAADEAATVKK